MIMKSKRDGSATAWLFDAVQDLGNIDYVKDGNVFKNTPCVGVLVSAESELDLLENYPPGTIAFTAGFTTVWQKDADGDWLTMVG